MVEKINEIVLFNEKNIDKIEEGKMYSLNYRYSLNLKEYCSRLFAYLKDGRKVWNMYVSLYERVDNQLISFLRYISFDYYVSNNKFEKAREIFEKELQLFESFKSPSDTSDYMIVELIDVILEKNYKDCEDEWRKQDEKLDDILRSKDKFLLYNYFSNLNIPLTIKINIKVLLNFYIDCYYYFRHFKDEENIDKLYEFLLYFKEGYDIDDFILKCRYIKMAEDLNENKIDNIDDIKEVDMAIDELDKKINDMKLVNQFEIDDVEKNIIILNSIILEKKIEKK